MNYEARDYEVRIWWSARDEAFVAQCTEFAHISAVGDTREEAAREIQVALELVMEMAREENLTVPEPVKHAETAVA